MKQSRIITATLVASITVFSQFTYAANLRFLEYSPARYFSDKDWEIGKNKAREALDKGENGVTISWENPDSKNSGKYTPTDTATVDGKTCRSLRIEHRAYNGLQGNVVYQFCKKPDGKWGAQPLKK